MYWAWQSWKKIHIPDFNTTVTNFSSDLMGFDNLQAGALRPGKEQVHIMRNLIWHLFWGE